MKKYFNPTLFLVGFCSIETINASISQIPNTTQTNTLDVIKVFADINSTDQTTQIDKFGGKSTISSAQLGMMAPQNGDITSALRIHPNVQFKRDAKNSNNAGEISPQDISINGGFFYQNNFSIDGINANNDLNPDALKKYNDNHTLPFGLMDSKSQGLNLDISLVDKIYVYDSLVPAKFGGFNGGVIDVKTKIPSKNFGGKFSVSHTRSQWMRKFVEKDTAKGKKIDGYGAIIPHQEKFKKTAYRAFAEGFVNDKFGLEFAFSRIISQFPQSGFDKNYINLDRVKSLDEATKNKIYSSFDKKLKRKQDNFFLKGIYYIDDTHTLMPTISYAPNSSDNYLAHSIDSYSKEFGKDFMIGLKLESEYDNFKIEQNLAYSRLTQKRKSDTNYLISWWDRGWGAMSENTKSYEGGYGNLEQSQESMDYNFDILTNSLTLGNTTHKINFGFDYAYKIGKFYSPQTSYFAGDASSEAHSELYDSKILEAEQKISEQEKIIQHYKQEQLNKQYGSQEFNALEARIKHHEDIKNSIEEYKTNLELAKAFNSFEIFDPQTGKIKPEYSKCLPNDPLCYGKDDGTGFAVEQFFKRTQVYKKGKIQAKMRQLGVYLDDEILFKRLTLRPGVRFDYDSFLNKTTLSPRFAGIYDILGSEKWLISFGANRYYGRNSFAWKLNDEILNNLLFEGTRDLPNQNFTLRKIANQTTFKGLKVPYVDERAIGTGVVFGNLSLNAKYVLREGKDQIMTKKISDATSTTKPLYQYTNDGRTKSHIYTLVLKTINPYQILSSQNSFEIAFDYTKTRRNLETGNYYYATTNDPYINAIYENKSILYNGKLIKLKDKPASTFNTPWSIRLSTDTKIKTPNLTWSNFFTMQGAYKMDVDVSGEDKWDGYPYQVIETKRFKPTFNWDTRINYTQNIGHNVQTFVNFDVLNVLNKKSTIGFNNQTHENHFKTTSYDNGAGYETLYSTGRQFWLEVGVKF